MCVLYHYQNNSKANCCNLADLKIFVTADVFALVVQAAGGGIASSATTNSGSANGAHIMLAGIFLQMGENATALLVALSCTH